jgi:hypothetical protein
MTPFGGRPTAWSVIYQDMYVPGPTRSHCFQVDGLDVLRAVVIFDLAPSPLQCLVAADA